MGSSPTPRTFSAIPCSLIEFAFHLRREGYKPSTIESNVKALKALAKLCDLDDSESVKDALARRNVCDGRKETLVDFYRRYARWKGRDQGEL